MSFSFTFFVHGDTVCASIDLREHPAVRPLTKEHLAEAAAAFTAASGGAAQRGQTQDGAATPGGGTVGGEAGGRAAGGAASSAGTASLPAASPVDGEKPAAAAATPTQARKVMLAPFGIAAILTGNSYKASDPMAEKILEDWASFFPLCNKDNTDVPPVVEVVSGAYRQRGLKANPRQTNRLFFLCLSLPLQVVIKCIIPRTMY